MKRPGLALAAAISLVALMPASTLAIAIDGVVDQSNTGVTYSIGSTANLAQTFTAGNTGCSRASSFG